MITNWMNQSTPKHKVFVSFHHDDDNYRLLFESKFGNSSDGFISRSVQDGDIDPQNKTDTIRQNIRDKFISDATVTIVLIGLGTWRRKHVDWEIAYSLRNTQQTTRAGLLGIILPSYAAANPDLLFYSQLYPTMVSAVKTDGIGGHYYDPHTIPPRLHDNKQCGYAKIYPWPSSVDELMQWIHEAFSHRKAHNSDNSRSYFACNRSDNQSRWED